MTEIWRLTIKCTRNHSATLHDSRDLHVVEVASLPRQRDSNGVIVPERRKSMDWVPIMERLKCDKWNTYSSEYTVSRRGKTREAAYQAAMPLAMKEVYDRLNHYSQSLKCPNECQDRDENIATHSSETYSYSRWHAFLSYLPFGGAGGWTCTATFQGDLSIMCTSKKEG